MGVFFVLFVYMLLIAFIFQGNSNCVKKRKMETLWMGIGPFLVLALRSPECGVDLLISEDIGYYANFTKIAKSSWADILTPHYFHNNYEIGYLVYNKIVSCFSDNPQFFLAITALVCVGSVSYVIYKYSSNIFLSFLVYVSLGLFIFSFSGLRQAMAISISLIGMRFIVNRKKWHYLMAVLLAMSFHTSSIVLFFVWPLCQRKMKESMLVLSLILVIALIPVLKIILETALSVIGIYSLDINEGQAITMFFVYFALLAASIFFKPKYNDDLHRANLFSFYRWMILLAVFCQSLGFIDSGYLTRIGLYFSIYFCLYLPELLNGLKKDLRSISYPIIVVLFIAFFYLTTIDGYLNVVPYSFFWEYRV